MFMFLMRRLPPRSTLTVTLFPYTTLFRSLPFADPPRRSVSILRNGPVATPFAARMAAHQPHRRLSLDRPRCAIVRPQAASPDARRRRSGETLAYIWVRSMRSEEHTSELQSLMRISYPVFGLKKQDNKSYP